MTPLILSEQFNGIEVSLEDLGAARYFLENKDIQKYFFHNQEMLCFKLWKDGDRVLAETNYFIGADWLIENEQSLYVEPKLNNENRQVDYLGMLLSALEETENLQHLDGLFHVEYERPWITLKSQQDILSPILMVQFLKLVQKIVRKGLKKSYYRVTENLNSRVKGKILVGAQIKQNIVKNRLTRTVCNYQEFGVNNQENQFLKLVLKFASSYLSQRQHYFKEEQFIQLRSLINYCLPAFEQVDELNNVHQNFIAKTNVFYKEYEEGIKIGNYILKRFSFNINMTSQTETTVPPFWIDMSKLFELYVFGKLKKAFPIQSEVTYHDRYIGGKETDILIRAEGYKCVIDCKYKPRYEGGTIDLGDKRQLAGYTRLKSVYKKLELGYDKVIPGVIVYSHQGCSDIIKKEDLLNSENRIDEYVDFYKIGVKLLEVS